jgi:hypothetical protein
MRHTHPEGVAFDLHSIEEGVKNSSVAPNIVPVNQMQFVIPYEKQTAPFLDRAGLAGTFHS